MSRLSNRQNIRLGGLIAVLGKRVPYDVILKDLIKDELVEWDGDLIVLTDKGVNEKDRLAILAGLMVEEGYVSTRSKNIEAINKCR